MNFFYDVIDPETNLLYGKKPWFIAFCKNAECSGLGVAWDDQPNNYRFINFGKVDCTERLSLKLCYEFEIDEMPTMIFLANDLSHPE